MGAVDAGSGLDFGVLVFAAGALGAAVFTVSVFTGAALLTEGAGEGVAAFALMAAGAFSTVGAVLTAGLAGALAAGALAGAGLAAGLPDAGLGTGLADAFAGLAGAGFDAVGLTGGFAGAFSAFAGAGFLAAGLAGAFAGAFSALAGAGFLAAGLAGVAGLAGALAGDFTGFSDFPVAVAGVFFLVLLLSAEVAIAVPLLYWARTKLHLYQVTLPRTTTTT